MKFFTMLFFALITMFSSNMVFAGVQMNQEQLKQVNESITAKLAVMSDSQKKELLENLNGSNDSIGKGIANFGEELGRGLGSAAKELGIAANEFANSKVGTIAIIIIFWHFIGKSILWLIFISILMFSLTKFWKRILSVTDEKGKVIGYDLGKLNKIGDGSIFIWFTSVCIIGACFVGAATQF